MLILRTAKAVIPKFAHWNPLGTFENHRCLDLTTCPLHFQYNWQWD